MKRVRLFFAVVLLFLAGCERPDPEVSIIAPTLAAIAPPPTPIVTAVGQSPAASPTVLPDILITRPAYAGTPTPDPPRVPANGENQPFAEHVVSAGETLGYIAQFYGSSVAELQTANDLDSDLLFVGQTLRIPTQTALSGPSFKLIPDSELVYGPAARDFDVAAFVSSMNGYLANYREEVEGQTLSGPEILLLVAKRFSVNPRLLLAALEYRSGWVTRPAVADDGYPMQHREPRLEGLYNQLSWAADEMNWGYYGRAEGGQTSFLIGETTRVAFAPDINDGTAGVQNWLGAHADASYETWLQEAGPNGFFAVYNGLFGNPFAFTVDPLWPDNLAQPPFALPWAEEETWYFTGGPHGGWASGSAWAALDFVPSAEQLGCVQSEAWVTAVADGLVIRSDFGAVVVDMDGDNYAGTGWVVTYMHLESRDRIAAGTIVQTGDRLGHPSCEGGFSNASHLHISRAYNGRWVAADGPVPFEMSSWISQGTGREYDGFLVRGGVAKEACECREELNTLSNQ